MENSHPQNTTKKSLFEVLPSKQSFWLGFVTAILAIGTLGFIILGSCLLGGSCAVSGLSLSAADTEDAAGKSGENAAPAAAQPTAAPTASTVAAVSDGDYIRGDENAPITIIEYSDFECPFCSRFHPTMLQVMDEYEGQVRWVYRHFPLSFHPEAENSAVASECAGQQGKFWEMADALFDNQTNLGEDLYFELAAEFGLNAADFTTCYEGDEAIAKVRAQAQEGAQAGVTGTPGSFIIDEDGNATPIKGALPFSSVAAAIDSML